jgi:hypothetical protein
LLRRNPHVPPELDSAPVNKFSLQVEVFPPPLALQKKTPQAKKKERERGKPHVKVERVLAHMDLAASLLIIFALKED